MCGRFVVVNVASELVGVLHVDLMSDELPSPSYNIAPTARIAIVLDSAASDPPARRLETARWGLIPGWAKDPAIGARAFNARSEELEHKPMYRAALIKRRAVIPATGYYEWKTHAGVKQPYFIHRSDGAPLLFAGLYEWWKDRTKADDDPDRWVLSVTMLTRDSTGGLSSIHDRMPLMLDVGHAEAWLDTTLDRPRDVLDAAHNAVPAHVDELDVYPVSRAVGNVRNDSPALIEPMAED